MIRKLPGLLVQLHQNLLLLLGKLVRCILWRRHKLLFSEDLNHCGAAVNFGQILILFVSFTRHSQLPLHKFPIQEEGLVSSVIILKLLVWNCSRVSDPGAIWRLFSTQAAAR